MDSTGFRSTVSNIQSLLRSSWNCIIIKSNSQNSQSTVVLGEYKWWKGECTSRNIPPYLVDLFYQCDWKSDSTFPSSIGFLPHLSYWCHLLYLLSFELIVLSFCWDYFSIYEIPKGRIEPTVGFYLFPCLHYCSSSKTISHPL